MYVHPYLGKSSIFTCEMAGSTNRTNQPSPTKATNLGWTSDGLKPEAFTAAHIHNHKAAATPEVEAPPAPVAPTAEVGVGVI